MQSKNWLVRHLDELRQRMIFGRSRLKGLGNLDGSEPVMAVRSGNAGKDGSLAKTL
jgi:hypothetical protein